VEAKLGSHMPWKINAF